MADVTVYTQLHADRPADQHLRACLLENKL